MNKQIKKIVFVSLLTMNIVLTPNILNTIETGFNEKIINPIKDAAEKAPIMINGVKNLIVKDIPGLISAINSIVKNIEVSVKQFETNIKKVGKSSNPGQTIEPFYELIESPIKTIQAIEEPLSTIAQMITNLGTNIVGIIDKKAGDDLLKTAYDIEKMKIQISDIRIKIQGLLPILKESTLGLNQRITTIVSDIEKTF